MLTGRLRGTACDKRMDEFGEIRLYEPLGNIINQIYFWSSCGKVNGQYEAPNTLSDIMYFDGY
jgi:hypothetical protein